MLFANVRSRLIRFTQAAIASAADKPLACDSSPAQRASVPPPADASPGAEGDRRRFIEAGLLTVFMRGSRFRQRVGATLMIVFVVFCWGHAEAAPLLAWLAIGLAILTIRNRCEHAYERRAAPQDAGSRAALVERLRPIYAAHGALWGCSLLFSFDRIPVYDQMGCWLALACVASAPLTSVALVPRLSKAYTHALFIILVGIMFALTASKDAGSESPHYLLLGLPLFYWWLLDRFGKGIYRNQCEQLGLQFDIALKEQEARVAVETKDRFLAAASHDMRQPVMALSLYAEHLVAFPDMHLELAPKIAVASQAVKSLFESLFDLANLDSGRVVPALEPVKIADVLHRLHVQFEPLAAARNIELRVRSVDAQILTDSVRLQRMIGNVVGNAIKYSPPGRKILLAARARSGDTQVEVIDQGFGIPPQDIEKVFHEFYRVDRAGMPAIDGVGLGLSIVSRLSKILNTRIQIRSVVGQGTRFCFRIGDVDSNGPSRSASLDVG